MEKNIQLPSLILGVVAFGIYAVAMATVPEFATSAAIVGVLIAVAAGIAQAHAGPFFTGVALAFGCWVCLGVAFSGASGRASAIVIVPLVFAMTIGLGAVGFLVGRVIGRIGRTLMNRRPVR